MYQYSATLNRVVDGDTIDLEVDLGFHLKASLRFRLMGVDTPELRGGTPESKARARAARSRVDYLLRGHKLTIQTYKADSFGRWLATVYYPRIEDGIRSSSLGSLSATLIREGHGVLMEGK